eukprot:3051263-Prymnesium_polylepis.3
MRLRRQHPMREGEGSAAVYATAQAVSEWDLYLGRGVMGSTRWLGGGWESSEASARPRRGFALALRGSRVRGFARRRGFATARVRDGGLPVGLEAQIEYTEGLEDKQAAGEAIGVRLELDRVDHVRSHTR